jgi:hypothetical protein
MAPDADSTRVASFLFHQAMVPMISSLIVMLHFQGQPLAPPQYS